MKPILVLAGLLLLAGGAALSLLTEPTDRADLSYVNPSGIHTLDPARMSWTQDLRIALNVWEGLTTYDPSTTAPIPGAAFPPAVSDDGLTYTFTIRPDARWSNGDLVLATDFVRGWRRALEPGTAADYSFFFTDHLAGAAEYVHWRQEAAAVLAPLSRLAAGWGVTLEQARALTRHPALERIRASVAPGELEPLDSEADTAWQDFAVRLGRADVDWEMMHREVFDAHAAQLDERFARVGLATPNERTLVVTLTRPCAYFLDLAAFPTLMPIHSSIELLRESHRGAPLTAEGLVVYDPQWTKPAYERNGYPGLVTNGPYRVSDWRFKRRLRLKVNPYYREAKAVACRTVDMLVYPDVNTALLAYEAGHLDFLPALEVPYDHEIARLASAGVRPDFHLSITLATYFFNFNCASESVFGQPNPLRDSRVRRALTLATDRTALVERVLQRGDRVARSFVPPDAIPGYEPPPGLPYDVAQARDLLAQAGYPEGAGLPPLEILYVSTDERVCQSLARMWEEQLGVTVELRCKESKTFAEDKANQRYLIARGNWYADYNDPTTFLDCLLTGNGNNDSGYSSAAYDALLAEAAVTTDATQRAKLLQQAEAHAVEHDCPILPVLHYATPIAIKPYVHGLEPNARLLFLFRHARVER